MSAVKSRIEAVMDAVPHPEITDFMDQVQERMATRHVTPAPTAERALQDAFILDDYDMEEGVASELVTEIDRALEDYRNNELFTVDVPTFDEPFHREFWRYRREERGTNGFKEVYRSGDGEYIALIPKRGDTLRDRAERVVTWLHNAETIAGEGYALPTAYGLTMTDRNGFPYPALLGRYNTTMTLTAEMSEEEREEVWPALAEVGWTVSQLVVDGMVASSKLNDYYGPQTEFNQAYDFEAEEVVVPELGELYEPTFEKDIVNCDSREEFITRHGIDERVDDYLKAFDLSPAYGESGI